MDRTDCATWATARLGFVALAVALIAAMPTSAWASGFGVVSVDLRPEGGKIPTHLCVASTASSARARDVLKAFLSPIRTTGDADQLLKPQAWSGIDDPGAPCSMPGQRCAARVTVPHRGATPADLHFACTRDGLAADEPGSAVRVVVLVIERPDGAPPPIDSVSLTGGVASIGVGVKLGSTTITVRSLGGHYLPSDRSHRADALSEDSKLAVLPLVPRCRWLDVRTPKLRLAESDRAFMSVRVHGEPVDATTCVGPLHGSEHWRVAAPVTSSEHEGTVDVAISSEAPRAADARFQAQWRGPWPSSLSLEPETLKFGWRAPACIFPDDLCPVARLHDGTGCAAERQADRCAYSCPDPYGPTRRPNLSTPLTITFEHEPTKQIWREVLQAPDEVLTGFVPRDETYLRADFGTWGPNVPGNRITHVDILRADGSEERHAVQRGNNVHVPVPRVSCIPMRYRAVGERNYREGHATISNGRIEFGDVHATARVLSVSATLAQGGTMMLHTGSRPTDFPSPRYFVGHWSVAAIARPQSQKWARYAGELRVGGTIGEWGYVDETTASGQFSSHIHQKLLWIRFLAEPALRVHVAPRTAVSAGVGIGGSWPAAVSNIDLTGRFRFVVSPVLDIRFSIRPHINLVLQGRGILREKTSYWQGNETQRRVRQVSGVSLSGLYGLELVL